MEKFRIVPVVGGFVTTPDDTNNHPLLSDLHGSAVVSEPVKMASLGEFIGHLKSVAIDRGISLLACGDLAAAPTIILRQRRQQSADRWQEGFDGIKAALVEIDTGRWDWDRITCCLTGKNANLEPCGYQGIELIEATRGGVHFVVHGGKTFTGDDMSLNLSEQDNEDEEVYERARAAFMEQAQLVIEGTYSGYGGQGGEWTGVDWFLTFEISSKVQWSRRKDGSIDYARTASRIHDRALQIIKPWEDEMILADKMMSQLAGWIDEKGANCEEGSPASCAAWIQAGGATMSEGYLSDDQEMRLRQYAPVQCRLCRHLLAKKHLLSGKPVVECERPKEAANSDILAALLMDTARADRCAFFSPFSEALFDE